MAAEVCRIPKISNYPRKQHVVLFRPQTFASWPHFSRGLGKMLPKNSLGPGNRDRLMWNSFVALKIPFFPKNMARFPPNPKIWGPATFFRVSGKIETKIRQKRMQNQRVSRIPSVMPIFRLTLGKFGHFWEFLVFLEGFPAGFQK